jgi:N-acetylglucosamine-6-phosphate deacetylase
MPMLTAGLVDLQVNGFAGVDFNADTITPAEIDRAMEAMLATGVTLCLPTIITAHPHELDARLRGARRRHLGEHGSGRRCARAIISKVRS